MQSNSSDCVGLSGEFFAASVLQRRFKAIAFATSSSPFDLICESNAGFFYRCQVKSTASTNTVNTFKYWMWRTSRSKNMPYKKGDVDFFALVSLPSRAVLFVLPRDIKSCCYRVRVDSLDQNVENESLNRVLETFSE